MAGEEHLPLYDELVRDYPVQYIAGGATQNSIRVAQWMSQKPSLTSYIGCIGKDEFGATLEKAARDDGVTPHYLVDEEKPTGTCAVLLRHRERSLVANLGAANEYKFSHMQSEPIQQVLHRAKIMYSAGFFLTVSPDSMVHMGEHCLKEGKSFMMNLSAPFLCSVFKDPMHRVLPYTNVVFGNESEAEAYAEANGLSDKSVAAVARHISELPKAEGSSGRMVIITQGSKSTVVAKDGETQEFPVPTIPEEEQVDFNGAGDAFVGGFLSRYLDNHPLEKCVKAGHWAAGVIIRTNGTTLPATCDYKDE